jgi:SAM-dependent methyltransferase
MVNESEKIIHFYLKVLKDCAYLLSKKAVILDFGCGSGTTVFSFQKHGYTAYGCDIRLKEPNETLRLIEPPYHLPFESGMFDVIFSDQVLEHVQDHGQAFSEISRVLKPDGISLHRFPAKWRPLESHTHVPFGGVFQNFPWLLIWATLGVRNEHQKGKNAFETTSLNHAYMRQSTNYVGCRNLLKIARRYFARADFDEKLLLKHGLGRSKYLYSTAARFPVIESLYGTFVSHFLVLRKQ